MGIFSESGGPYRVYRRERINQGGKEYEEVNRKRFGI